jgi:hypothetical protein
MGKKHHFGLSIIAFGLQINWQSFLDKWPQVKKNRLHKSCLHNLFGDGFRLINKGKVADGVVFTNVLDCAVH